MVMHAWLATVSVGRALDGLESTCSRSISLDTRKPVEQAGIITPILQMREPGSESEIIHLGCLVSQKQCWGQT
jgi:hypothetical protein